MLKLDDFSRTRRLAGASALALLGAATSLAAWAAQPADVRFAWNLPSPEPCRLRWSPFRS